MDKSVKTALLIGGGIAFATTVAIGLGLMRKTKVTVRKIPNDEDESKETGAALTVIHTIEQNCAVVKNLLEKSRDQSKKELSRLLLSVAATLEQNSRLLNALNTMNSKATHRLRKLCGSIDALYNSRMELHDSMPDEEEAPRQLPKTPQPAEPVIETPPPAPAEVPVKPSAEPEEQDQVSTASSTEEETQNDTSRADRLLAAIKEAESELQTLQSNGEPEDTDRYASAYKAVEDAYEAYDSALSSGEIAPPTQQQ